MTITINVDGPIRTAVARAEAAADAAEAAGSGVVGEINTALEAALAEIDAAAEGVTAGASRTVATLAALTAINPATLSDGDVWDVAAYSADTGQGGGRFRWDETSEAGTDGGTVFVPDDLASAVVTESLSYATANVITGTYALAHADIIWGSFTAQYADTETVDSKWLHGHSMQPRHAVGAAVIESNGLVDHKNGVLNILFNFRWRNLVESNVATHATNTLRTSELNYRYATGPGRWVRIIEGDYVTPAMFGGKYDIDGDATRYDNSFAICWAWEFLNNQTRIKVLSGEGATYYLVGHWGEIYEGLTLRNIKIKYFGEDPASPNSGGAIDFTQSRYLGSDATWRALGFYNPYRLLWLHHTCLRFFDNSDGAAFENIEIDGNVSDNMYFLANPGGLWDVTPITGTVSANLRESPVYCGISVGEHAGRYVSRTMVININNVHVHDMAGGCILCYGPQLVGSCLRLGNTLSGRLLYGAAGSLTNLEFYGYTRTSHASPPSGRWSNIRIHNLLPNPWPENALDPASIAHRSSSRTYEPSAVNPGEDARFDNWLMAMSNVSVDLNGLNTNAPFKWSGEMLTIDNFTVKGPMDEISIVLRDDADNGANSVSTAGPILRGGWVRNRSIFGVNWVSDTQFGQSTGAYLSDITISELFAQPNRFTYNYELDNAAWTKTNCSISTNTANGWHANSVLDRIIENSSLGTHRIHQQYATTTGRTVVLSAFVRAGSGRDVYLYSSAAGGVYAFFDVSAEAFSYVSPALEADYGDYGFTEPDGGLYRIWIKVRETAGANQVFALGLADGVAGEANATYTGDGTSYVDAGGLRVEEYTYNREAIPGPNIIVTTADSGGQRLSQTLQPQRAQASGARIRMTAQPTGNTIPEQVWTFENINDETLKDYWGYIQGGDTASNVPTRMIYRNCKLNTDSNRLFRTSATNGLQNAVNLRIEMDGCRITTYASNLTYEGDNTAFLDGTAKVIMRDCYTAEGRVSDLQGLFTVTAVAAAPTAGQVETAATNTAGYIDFAVPLLWVPRFYSAAAVSEDAVAAGVSYVEALPTSSRYDQPSYRVHLTNAIADGDVLTFDLRGAVCPARTL